MLGRVRGGSSRRSRAVAASAALSLLQATGCVRPEDMPGEKVDVPGLVRYEPGEIERFIDRTTGAAGGRCGRVERSASGDRLYCHRGEDEVIVSPGGTVNVLKAPGLVSLS